MLARLGTGLLGLALLLAGCDGGGSSGSGDGCGGCDDQVACTVDRCDEATGACVHEPDDSGCAASEVCQVGAGCVPALPCEAGSACNDGGPCTMGDACQPDGVCRGAAMRCDTPPGPVCLQDGTTLRTYAASGSCSNGTCFYPEIDTPCPQGCAGGACVGDPCAGQPCDQPPGQCFASPGTCQDGQCRYQPTDGAACDDGDACTAQDTCASGACLGTPVTCDEPPGRTCLDEATLRSWRLPGRCAAGECTYEPDDVGCPSGCADGACVGAPCAGVVCDQPPSACHAAEGTCVDGDCFYDAVDGAGCDDGDACTVGDTCVAGSCAGTALACDRPPVPECVGDALRVYDLPGTCAGGVCSYATEDVACTDGCAVGACLEDPCRGQICTSPPNGCHESPGVCQDGECRYTPIDGGSCDDGDPCTTGDHCAQGLCEGAALLCDTPPAPECSDGRTLAVWTGPGRCEDGACGYPVAEQRCDAACVDGACAAPGALNLLFSEYVEGAGNDKILEILNIGTEPVDLSRCRVDRYSNGATSPTRIELPGVELVTGAVFVICHSEVTASVLSSCDLTTASLNHNGDDALELVCDDQVLDVFGRIGEDPGTAWGTGGVTTVDHVLRRACDVEVGDRDGTDPFDPAAEWAGLAPDRFDDVGQWHCSVGPAEVCDDRVDNDQDGTTDCADFDCRDDLACGEDCEDGVDNDVDGATDCADSDCRGSSACAEVCDDGVDNDVDGQTDCDDGDCEGEPACPDECDTDALDPNDTRADAAALDVNGVTTGLRLSGARSDWYRLEPCKWLRFNVAVRPLAGDGDIDLTLYDADGNWLASSTSDTSYEDATIDQPDGAIYVLVYLKGSAVDTCREYEIEVTAAGCGEAEDCSDGGDNDRDGLVDCADADCAALEHCLLPCAVLDRFEHNDSQEDAALVPPNLEASGLVIDERLGHDWYRVHPCPGSPLTVELEAPDVEDRVRAVLRDAEGDVLDDCIQEQSVFCRFEVSEPSDRPLFVQVISFQSCTEYDLRITNPGCDVDAEDCVDFYDNDRDGAADCADTDCTLDPRCAAPCEHEDPFAPNSSRETAAAVGVNEALSPLLASGTESDWFVFEPCVGMRLTVNVDFLPEQGAMEFTLYDAAGAEIVTSVDNGAVFDEATLWPASRDAMFLEVHRRWWTGMESCGFYGLTISSPGCQAAEEPDGGLDLLCDDGFDNDRDGQTDCDDAPCGAAWMCQDPCDDDDPLEPNDVREAATVVIPNSSYPRLVSTSGDADWFVVEDLCMGGQLFLYADTPRQDHGIELRLLDEAGELIGYDHARFGYPAWFDVRQAYRAPVYLRVVNDNDNDQADPCAHYDLTVRGAGCPGFVEACGDGLDNDADGATDCADTECAGDEACDAPCVDAYEPNGSWETAVVLGLDASLTGLSTSEQDWDVFDLPVCDHPSVDIHARYDRALGDIELVLIEALSEETVATGAAADDGTRLTMVPDGAHFYHGHWRLLVRSTTPGACIPYDLDVHVGTDACESEVCFGGADEDGDGLVDCEDEASCWTEPLCVSCPDDGREPNDGAWEATSAAAGETLSGLRLVDRNPDFFAIDVTAGLTLDVDVSYEEPQYPGLALSLWDQDGYPIATSYERPVEGGTGLGWFADRSGRVFVELGYAADSPSECVAYDIAFALGLQPEICDDGADNDGDGVTDCLDADCFGSDACNEICDDDIDNDADGAVDCDDPDCGPADPACPVRVLITVSNSCGMTVTPGEVYVANGECWYFEYMNSAASEYVVDLAMSYGGGYLDLFPGETWLDVICRCGPGIAQEGTGVESACSSGGVTMHCN